ncbi:MAG TPA: twin-arginine translocase TatA/TatE family subunit [Sporichthyaceae bacterium]|jgi:TatA/E family protein of Tat protein translocase|nr:twin-arginine translocase TatA/TatE family subunit [Sporichthyaceae bacterium]
MGRGIEVFLLVLLGVVLFGAKRLPDAAKALGESLHLFKKAIRDDEPRSAPPPPIRQISGETEPPADSPRGTDPSA